MNKEEKEFMEDLNISNIFMSPSSLTFEEKKKLFELLFEIRDFYKEQDKKRRIK